MAPFASASAIAVCFNPSAMDPESMDCQVGCTGAGSASKSDALKNRFQAYGEYAPEAHFTVALSRTETP